MSRFPLWPCRITALQKTMQSEQVATEPVIDVTDYELKRYLQQMDPFEFEELVAHLWVRKGWDTEVDGGT